MSIHSYQGSIWSEIIAVHDSNKDTFPREVHECFYMLCQVGVKEFLFVDISEDVGNRLNDHTIRSFEDIKKYYPGLVLTNKKVGIF